MLIGLFALPFLLHRIGIDRFGVLTLVWTLIGYFSIFDLGLGRALTHRIAALRIDSNAQRIDSAISFGMSLMLIVGVVGSLIVCSTIYFFGIGWLNVGQEVYKQAYWAIFVASFGIPLATLTSGLKGVLEGYENFQNINLLKALLGASNFLLPVISVELFGPNLVLIVFSLVIARGLFFIAHLQLVVRLLGRAVKFKISGSDESSAKLVNFGGWMTLSNIVSPLMTVADRFLISHYTGSASVAHYSVPLDFIFRITILPASIATTLFPIFSKELKQNDNKVKDKYLRYQLFILGVMAPICLATILFSHYGLTIWMGRIFADASYQVANVISIGVFFNSFGQIPLTLLQADGRVKLTSMLHLAEFAIYAPLLIIAISNFGIMGAAYMWTLRAFMDSLLLNFIAMKFTRFIYE